MLSSIDGPAKRDLRQVARVLLIATSLVAACNPDGPAVRAAQKKEFGRMLELIDRSGASPNEADQVGATLLMDAATSGDCGVERSLVSRRADLRSKDRRGLTALNYAVFANRTDLVSCLLDSGAAVDAGDVAGRTPLYFAIQSGNMAVARVLLRRGAATTRGPFEGYPSIGAAVEHGCSEAMIDLLLSHGADINGIDRGGRTPLMYAKSACLPSCIRVLMARGADPLKKASNGTTALSLLPDPARRCDAKAVMNALNETTLTHLPSW